MGFSSRLSCSTFPQTDGLARGGTKAGINFHFSEEQPCNRASDVSDTEWPQPDASDVSDDLT